MTTNANGNLATSNFGPRSIGAFDGRIGGLESNVAQLQGDLKRSFEGTAIPSATGGAVLPEGKACAISANYRTFAGQNGFAASAVEWVADFVYLNGAVGAGLAQSGVGGRAGLTFAW